MRAQLAREAGHSPLRAVARRGVSRESGRGVRAVTNSKVNAARVTNIHRTNKAGNVSSQASTHHRRLVPGDSKYCCRGFAPHNTVHTHTVTLDDIHTGR